LISPSGGFDFTDVDLAHFHHRGAGAFGFSSVRSEIFVATPPTKIPQAPSGRHPRIPTGFRPKAQGCAARATLGQRPTHISNRNAVAAKLRPERNLCSNAAHKNSPSPAALISAGFGSKIGFSGRFGRFADLQTSSASLRAGFASLSTKFAGLPMKSADLRRLSAGLQTKFSTLRKRFTSLRTTFANLRTKVASLRTARDSLRTRFARLSTSRTSLRGDSASLLVPWKSRWTLP
jgi:hypothetical protein